MIVDVHTHLWASPDQLGPRSAQRIRDERPVPWDRPDASEAAHLRATRGVVTHAFVLGFQSLFLNASIPARQIAHHVARDRARFIGFAGIDPADNHCLDTLAEAVELGLRGVVVSPLTQNISPTDERAMRLFDACAGRNLPVLIHGDTHLAPSGAMEHGQPWHLDAVAQTFPTLRLVVAQVGWPWLDQTLDLIARREHVYADLSRVLASPAELERVLIAAHARDAIGKLLLGSDFPFTTPADAIRNLYRAHPRVKTAGVTREAIRTIVERDALRCLDICVEVSQEQTTAGPRTVTVNVGTGDNDGDEGEADSDAPPDRVPDPKATASKEVRREA